MNLREAFRLPDAPRLALVGAGGKTTALFDLARAFPPPVLLTTTTHMGEWQAGLADLHRRITAPEELDDLEASLPSAVILLTGPRNEVHNRIGRVDPASLERIREMADRRQVPMFIEADGSRMLPLKAPASYEPVVPGFVDHVVVVAGLVGIGQPLDGATVHRPEIFGALAGLQKGEPISIEAVRRVLLHPEGGLKDLPPGARRLALLTQPGSATLESGGLSLARSLTGVYDAAVVSGPSGVLAVYAPVAGVILAAGGSRRMGQPKLLLPWNGEPLVRHVARTALAAGLSPVVLVTGAYRGELTEAVAGLPVQVTLNPDWEAGQSTSLRAGIRSLPDRTAAAVFLLGDQPQIPARLVNEMVEWHAFHRPAVLAPFVGERRGNPLMFDRALFAELSQLEGDAGGRQLLARFPPDAFPWDDENILADIDTPEDYRRFLAGKAGKE